MRRWGNTALAVAAVVLAGGVVVAGVGNGHDARDVRLFSGAAWLASSKVGQVTLLDGPSAEVAAQVQVAPVGAAIDVVQRGSTAYAVDQTAGTVRRVDGATFELSQPASPVPDAHGGLVAFAGPDTMYVLDSERGVLAVVDPRSLAPRGDPLPLAARLGTGAATVDDGGRLWVIERETGDLTLIDGQRRSKERSVVTPNGNSLITVANGRPVIVDRTDRKVLTIDPATGAVRARFDIELRPDEEVRISGSPRADRLYVTAGRGALVLCELARRNCDQAVPLEQNKLGAAVEAADRLFVPDFTTGRVWIINLGTRSVIAQPQVLDPAGQFQLLARDGMVFFNDAESDRAGVIHLDGRFEKVSKYDAKDPNKGVAVPNSDENPNRPAPSTQDSPPNNPPPSTNPPPTNGNPPPTNGNPPPANNPPPVNNPPPSNPPTTTTPGNPPTTTTPSNPPQAPPTLTITVSKQRPAVNEDISLRVSGDGNTAPTVAQWDFGDGSTGGGATVTHRWTTARTYQVSVQATMPDGRSATTSLSLEVTPPPNVTVPNVVGQSENNAKTAIQNVGLVPVVTRVADSSIPAGVVISQSPQAGAAAAPGSQVNLNVSSGPAIRFDFMAQAPSARWFSATGPVAMNAPDNDPNGQVRVQQNTPLENGTSQTCLVMHPNWEAGGLMAGNYRMPNTIVAGDHFKSTVGILQGHPTGEVNFSVELFTSSGSSVTNVRDNGADGALKDIDIDLTGVAGRLTQITIRIDANVDFANDWACWIAPRIEG